MQPNPGLPMGGILSAPDCTVYSVQCTPLIHTNLHLHKRHTLHPSNPLIRKFCDFASEHEQFWTLFLKRRDDLTGEKIAMYKFVRVVLPC